QQNDASRKIATCRLRQRRFPRSSARKAFTNFGFFATDFPTQHRSAALANHGARQDNTLVFSEVGHQPVSRACQDLAGNTASATVSGINTDKLRPLSLLLEQPKRYRKLCLRRRSFRPAFAAELLHFIAPPGSFLKQGTSLKATALSNLVKAFPVQQETHSV